jgi:replicative DNA helicase
MTKNKTNSIIKIGLNNIDQILGGLKSSNLYLIGSRPGIGKTEFILSMILNISIKQKIPIGIFSLDISKSKFVNMLIAFNSGIGLSLLQKKTFSKNEWRKFASKSINISEAEIFIDDSAGFSMNDIKLNAVKMVNNHSIQIIFINYLQLINYNDKSAKKSREQNLSDICQLLKKLSIELDIPIVITTQLSRSVEYRKNKKPTLNDILYADKIVKYFDTILFLYRSNNNLEEPNDGNLEFIIAKK